MKSTRKIFVWLTAFVAFESTLAYYSIYIYSRIGIVLFGAYFLISFILWDKVKTGKSLFTKESVIYLFSYVFIYIISVLNGYIPISLSLLWLLFGVIFISTKEDIKKETIYVFVNMVCFLLTISIVEYLLFITTGVTLFHTIVLRGTSRIYDHLLFNIYEDIPYMPIPRFQSLMDEPGLLGTLCAFLLYVISGQKRMYWQKTVLWISGFFSFSLAFFAIAPLIILPNVKIRAKYVMLVIIALFASYYFLQDYVDSFITTRLEREQISNRTHIEFETGYKKALDAGRLYLGMGAMSYLNIAEGGNAGAKVWIYQYGFIGLLLIGSVYIITYLKTLRKKFTLDYWHIFFLIIFWLSFLQREYIDAPYNVVIYFTIPYICVVVKGIKHIPMLKKK